MDIFNEDVVEKFIEKVIVAIAKSGMDIIFAIIFLLVGLKLVSIIGKFLTKTFEKRNFDPSISGFLLSLIKTILYVVVFISSAALMGIQVTSFVTLLGTVSLSIGLALQGSLANLAGGVLILILKPFKVGDYIMENSGKQEGTVTSIDIFYTKLRTIDNKVIVIPNGKLSDSSLINYTANGKRRFDFSVGIPYDSDLGKVRKVFSKVINNEPGIIDNEPVDIIVEDFGEDAVKMAIHVWVPTDEYWQIRWRMIENIKYAFDEEGIHIPYRQVDVHLCEEMRDKE